MPVAPLNLDTTLPDTDTSRAANTAAIVRWLTAADPRTLEAISRVFGDLGWRSQIIEQKINELIAAAELTHDLTGYTLTDGTKPFSGVINGVEGSNGTNLTTRAGAAAIASALIGSLSSTIDDVEVRVTALEALPIVRYSNWVEHVWTAGVKHGSCHFHPAYGEAGYLGPHYNGAVTDVYMALSPGCGWLQSRSRRGRCVDAQRWRCAHPAAIHILLRLRL